MTSTPILPNQKFGLPSLFAVLLAAGICVAAADPASPAPSAPAAPSLPPKSAGPAKSAKPAKPAPSSNPMDKAWQDAATFLVDDAHRLFLKKGDQKEDEADRRERALGEAVTRLNIQPRTDDNIARARQSLETLAQTDPGDNSDNVPIFAKFFLARVYESYETPAQPEKAHQLYSELLTQHAGNTVAETSAACLVLLDLYQSISPEERQRRFDELEKLAPLLKTSSGRRDYHLNLGNAYVDFHGSREKAIGHYVAADREGISQWRVEALTWIAIGELARADGRNDLAAEYYGKFLAKYKRDNRHYTIQKRLESLSQPHPATQG